MLRRMQACRASGTLILPFWDTSTWWHILAPDGVHLAEYVVDWLWLPREDPALFVPGQNSGNQRPHKPPAWDVLALRVDFSLPGPAPLSRSQRCVNHGCESCRSCSWHRSA